MQTPVSSSTPSMQSYTPYQPYAPPAASSGTATAPTTSTATPSSAAAASAAPSPLTTTSVPSTSTTTTSSMSSATSTDYSSMTSATGTDYSAAAGAGGAAPAASAFGGGSGGGGGGGGMGGGAPASATTMRDEVVPSFVARLSHSLRRQTQQYLDMSVPFLRLRWVFLFFLLGLYSYRVWVLQGFFIVTYGLAIFLLNLFIGFLSPLDDRDTGEGPMLPESRSDEYKPFMRRLPEFKFWLKCTKATCIAFALTFFSMFDVPVFWPILLIYFIVLFVLTMKRQIKDMINRRYLPFNFGKKQYGKNARGGIAPVVAPLGAALGAAVPRRAD